MGRLAHIGPSACRVTGKARGLVPALEGSLTNEAVSLRVRTEIHESRAKRRVSSMIEAA